MVTAVQQIMLGSVLKNEEQALANLKRIKEEGYDAIELNSFMIHKTSFLVRLLTKAAGMPVGGGGNLHWQRLIFESGLSVLSLHTDLGSLERDLEAVAHEAVEFGTTNVVITGMYRFDYTSLATVQDLARRLNEAGRKLKDHQLSLLYHNHNVELCKVKDASGNYLVKDGRFLTAYDVLMQETDPSYVNFEFDSFWFAEAGANVEKVMQALGSRMKLWHITDRGTRQAGSSMTPILKSDSMELGYGNMDLLGLLDTAKKNGVEGIVLESHRNWIDKDPIKSLSLSGCWLRQHCKQSI